MNIEEASLYLEHTSKDDFNLEEHQKVNRYEAIKVVLQEIERLNKRNKEIYEEFMATTKELTEYAEENERLRDLCEKYEEEHRTTFEEWKKTVNIINELKKFLEEERKKDRQRSDYNYGVSNAFDYIWYKLQELKGSDSNG